MPVVVEVVEPDAFQAWVDTRKDSETKLAQSQ
jgi:heme/copper-type cytochrome/quinol oxidase subunit 2